MHRRRQLLSSDSSTSESEFQSPPQQDFATRPPLFGYVVDSPRGGGANTSGCHGNRVATSSSAATSRDTPWGVGNGCLNFKLAAPTAPAANFLQRSLSTSGSWKITSSLTSTATTANTATVFCQLDCVGLASPAAALSLKSQTQRYGQRSFHAVLEEEEEQTCNAHSKHQHPHQLVVRHRSSRNDRNNHNNPAASTAAAHQPTSFTGPLNIDWANLDKKEFMKLVSSLDICDLFAEVVSDCVAYSEGSKKWQMPEYVLQRKDRRIFVGGQGFVLFVRRRQHSSSLAMKVCLHSACRSRMDRYQLKASLQVAAQRESRFISDLLVYYMTSRFFVSVMYKAKHSSLKVIKRDIGTFPARFVHYYAACMASALHRLHRVGICHKDVKADNVLIDHRGVPQLADFGLAVECKVGPEVYTSNRRVTTMQYYPPECLVLGGRVNDYKIDSWLFGFFISEIHITSSAHMWSKFHGSTADGWRFRLCESCCPRLSSASAFNGMQVVNGFGSGGSSADDQAHLSKLLRSLLRQEPRGRPSIGAAMRSAYFDELDWRQLEAELPPECLHVKSLLMERGDE